MKIRNIQVRNANFKLVPLLFSYRIIFQHELFQTLILSNTNTISSFTSSTDREGISNQIPCTRAYFFLVYDDAKSSEFVSIRT